MSICDVPVLGAICEMAGEGAATIVSAPFDLLAAGTGAAAQLLVGAMWTLLDQTTLVDLTNPTYLGVYNLVFGVAVVLVVVFFLAQVITGMIRRDPAALGRAGLGAAKAILGSFLVVTLAGLLLEVTDQLTVGVVQAAGMSMDELGTRLAALFGGLTLINLAAPGVTAIITIFLSCLAIAGTAIVWFSLLVRKALILAAIVLAPVALSGSAWDATRAWFGRWMSFVVALIVSKLVVVLVFLVAVVQMGAPIDLDLQSVADPLAGVVLMATAGFAPYLVYKLVSWAGFDMYHSISVEQEAKQALNRPLPVPAPLPTRWPTRSTGEAPAPQPSPAAEPAPGAAGGTTGATASAGGASGGATTDATATGGASSGGAAAAGTAAAGPAPAVVVGAELARGAAEAGPRAGAFVGQATDAQMSEAVGPGTASSPAPPAAGSAASSPAQPEPTTPSPPPPPRPAAEGEP
jgi:hypothetical protein